MKADISIEIQGSHYVLSGGIDDLLQNRRMLFSLKRLGFRKRQDGGIDIPFGDKTKIVVLQEIKELLKKFNIDSSLGKSAQMEVSAYHTEEKNFATFSKRAMSIRNNEFADNPDLIEGFNQFKSVLQKPCKETLYRLQILSSYHMAFSQNSCNFAVPRCW